MELQMCVCVCVCVVCVCGCVFVCVHVCVRESPCVASAVVHKALKTSFSSLQSHQPIVRLHSCYVYQVILDISQP